MGQARNGSDFRVLHMPSKLEHSAVRSHTHLCSMTSESRLRELADERIDPGLVVEGANVFHTRVRTACVGVLVAMHPDNGRSQPGAVSRRHVSVIAAGSPCMPRERLRRANARQPAAMLRSTLSLRPAPNRSGATVRRIRSNTSPSSIHAAQHVDPRTRQLLTQVAPTGQLPRSGIADPVPCARPAA